MGRVCSIPNCNRSHFGHGYCGMHMRRWRIYGDPLAGVRNFRGENLQFLERNISFSEDACLDWPFGRKGGYGEVTFRGSPMRASRAMCVLAHGEPPFQKAEAAHSCGNALCVNPKHLRWATAADNTADKWAHGTMLIGEQCNGSKLSKEAVQEIRRLSGRVTQRVLAERFGVRQSAISSVVNRRTWGHI